MSSKKRSSGVGIVIDGKLVEPVRAAAIAKLAKILDWLEACPRGNELDLQDRTLRIETGVESSGKATVFLHANWVCIREGVADPINDDEAPLGSRTYYEEAQTITTALLKLHVPRARRRASIRIDAKGRKRAGR